MRSRILCVLLGLAMGWTVVGLTACASYAPRVEKPANRPPVIYTPGRWIGLLEKGSVCPTVPGWTAQTLRELAAAHAEDGIKRKGECAAPLELTRANLRRKEKADALFHKRGLDRFCVYTSQGQGREFRTPAGLTKVVKDRMALAASADLGALGEQVWPSLAAQFIERIGSVQLGSAPNPTVRLVFVDTHPTGEGVPAKSPAPVSWHGYGMAHLANEIVCGHDPAYPNCPVHIATRLALRYDSYDSHLADDPGNDDGGHQGRLGDLATAILAEIDHWQHYDPETKLILNLSIGWDGEYIDLDAAKEAELEASAKAVYDALQYAHDLGVLVVAAAGNRSGAEDSHWPMLPAAWESHPPSWLATLFGKKIAYAVGGVDWQGLPLPNVRLKGLPQLVAYADHAVARTSDENGGEPTNIYTGSSVAAAVASSIAAVTWHLKPDWTPHEVMDELAVTAEPLPGTAATFYSESQTPQLKRLSLRHTVLNLCEQYGTQPCPTVTPQSPALPPANLADLFAAPPTVGPIAPPACDPQTAFLSAGSQAPDSSCPIETLQDMSIPAMTQPQPGETPCPPCNLAPVTATSGLSTMRPVQVASLAPQVPEPNGDSGGPKPYSLAADLDPGWVDLALHNNTTIESAILVIDCKNDPLIKERVDVTPQFQDLLSGTATPPARINFGAVGERTTLAGCTASVDFTLLVTVDGGAPFKRSVQSPVYVDP